MPIVDETCTLRGQHLIPTVESTQKDVQSRAKEGNSAASKNRRFEPTTLTGEEVGNPSTLAEEKMLAEEKKDTYKELRMLSLILLHGIVSKSNDMGS